MVYFVGFVGRILVSGDKNIRAFDNVLSCENFVFMIPQHQL